MDNNSDSLYFSWTSQKYLYFLGIFCFSLFLGFSYLAYLLPEAILHLSLFIFVTGLLTFMCFFTKKELYVGSTRFIVKSRTILGYKNNTYDIYNYTRVVVTVEAPDYYNKSEFSNEKNVLMVYMIGKENIEDFDLSAFAIFGGLNAKSAKSKIQFAQKVAEKTKLKLTIDDNLYEYVPNFKKAP